MGTYAVASGSLSVTLSNNASEDSRYHVIADAIKIVRVSDGQETIIDNGTAGYAKTGAWTQWGGGDAYNTTSEYADCSTGPVTAAATWTFSGLSAGRYQVYGWWQGFSWWSSGAPYLIKDGASTLDAFRVNQATASITLFGADTYIAQMPGAASSDVWLDGPQVKEWRQTVVPMMGNTPHPFLRVIFDVRSYADGGARVDVTVDNTLNITGATAATYAVDVVANGKTVYHHDPIRHGWLCRWRKVFDVGLTESSVVPDIPVPELGGRPS